MNSSIFYTLTPERILKAVESYGYRCTGRILQLNSLENRVYEVEVDCDNATSRYDNFKVIKFYRPGRWNDQQLEEEHAFLIDLDKELVPVALPVANPEGRYCSIELETEIRYALFPKIGGRLMDELDRKRLEKLGHTIARLHSVGARAEMHARPTLDAQTFGDKSLDTLERLAVVPEILSERFFSLADQICDIYHEKLQDFPLQRLHADLHLGNILWIDEQPLLVDFDDVVNGPVVQDLWLIAPGRDEDSLERRRILIQSYQELRFFDMRQLELVEWLRAIRIIKYNAWIAERWEDPIFQRTFPHYNSIEYWREQLVALDEIVGSEYSSENI